MTIVSYTDNFRWYTDNFLWYTDKIFVQRPVQWQTHWPNHFNKSNNYLKCRQSCWANAFWDRIAGFDYKWNKVFIPSNVLFQVRHMANTTGISIIRRCKVSRQLSMRHWTRMRNLVTDQSARYVFTGNVLWNMNIFFSKSWRINKTSWADLWLLV